MQTYYSASAGGFYADDIHGAAIPADAVEITSNEHAALLAAQADGRIITADETGRPVAIDPPAPTSDQLMVALRIERGKRLATALAILDRHRNQAGFDIPTTLKDEEVQAWAIYAQALRDLPETAIDPASPVWPDKPA